ncbi:hypothetical protein [Paenibacillus senegalensis]|uniref:hypothetical protein n=1 Tax=Paenibacillus senegalensis TaxID=1465766 RepID=UPI0002897637|nr:hypothetical protein [Paenibacillus senegalensis]
MTVHVMHRKPAQTTREETELVTEATLLPVLLTMIRRDLDKANNSPSAKLSLPQAVVLQRMLEMIHLDLIRVKKQLRKNGIRIYSEVKDAEGIRCKYLCREHRGNLTMSRQRVKVELGILAGKYVHARTG